MVPNHYQILNLPSTLAGALTLTREDIKAAYRRALLQHHPDKLEATSLSKASYSIDEIVVAYKTLSNPSTRTEHDRALRLQTERGREREDKAHHPGLETVDLDDMAYDERRPAWYRNCRCGNEHAFLLTEEDLDKEVNTGEIVVGCGGCSLWLRVVFQAVEEG